MADKIPIEISDPGAFIDLADRDEAFNASGLIDLLKNQLAKAIGALMLFSALPDPVVPRGAGQEAWARRVAFISRFDREAEQQVLADDPEPTGMMGDEWVEWDRRVMQQKELESKRRRWEAGELPEQIRNGQAALLAEAFIAAADMIGKLLQALGEYPSLSAVAQVAQAFRQEFPDLALIRDTIQHLEDRARWRGRPGKGGKPRRLPKQPVTLPRVIAPPGSVLTLPGWYGPQEYGGTTSDGRHATLPINDVTLDRLRDYVQRAIDAVPWKSRPGGTFPY